MQFCVQTHHSAIAGCNAVFLCADVEVDILHFSLKAGTSYWLALSDNLGHNTEGSSKSYRSAFYFPSPDRDPIKIEMLSGRDTVHYMELCSTSVLLAL